MIVMAGYDAGGNYIYVSGDSDWPENTTDIRITYPNGPEYGKMSIGQVNNIPVLSENETNPQEFTVYALDAQETVLGSRSFLIPW